MSYCLINNKNFTHNINLVTSIVDIDKVAFVLKNNAYGHGLKVMSELSSMNNIKHAVVINSVEAKQIYELFDSVLILSDIPSEIISPNISVAINQLEDISRICKGSSVELKIDTGMHRNGILCEELDQAIKMIDSSGLILKGVFTHFANIFEGNNSIYEQENKFSQVRSQLLSRGFDNIRFHCSSSPGLFCLDQSKYDLVRVGIALYGYVDVAEKVKQPDLKPILSLWAEKISTRKIYKNDIVGYGGAFKATKDMEISTYDLGYGDGFLRLNEEKQSCIDDGRMILGRVSMNNLTVEGSDNEICIFKNVEDLSKIHSTIPYEILCRINHEIDRRII